MFEARIYRLEFPDLICYLPDDGLDLDTFNKLVLNNTNPLNYLTFDGLGVDLIDNNLKFYQDGDYKIYALPHISSGVQNDFGEYPIEQEYPIEFTFPSDRFITRHLTMLFDENVRCKITVKWRSAEDNTELETTYEERLTNKTLTIELPDGVFRVWVWVVSSPLPNHFVKIESGFAGTMNVISHFTHHNLIEEINVISDDLPINQLEISTIGEEENFSKNDALTIFSNNKYYGTFYIKDIQRSGLNLYDITAQNAVSLFERPLTRWTTNAYGEISVKDINRNLRYGFESNNFNVVVDTSNIENEIITGNHKDGTCRAALCEIGYCTGYMVDSSRKNSISFVEVPNKITSQITNDSKRIIGNAIFKRKEDISAATISYNLLYPDDTLYSEYSKKTITGNIGDVLEIKFDKPTNIIEEGCEILEYTLYTYKVRLTSTTANILYHEKPMSSDYLVSIENDQAKTVNEISFNFLTRSSDDSTFNKRNENIRKYIASKGIASATIRLRSEKVGDLVQLETAWDGIITGIITKMNIVFGYEDIAEIEVLEWSL